jgi:hypothetical protein
MRGGEWVKGSGKEVPAGVEQVGPNSEVRGKASISDGSDMASHYYSII